MPAPTDILSESVAAVFVTMNRASTALTCLERLASQTTPPDAVYVFDNGSSDDTPDRVKAFRERNPELEIDYQRHPDNVGNAGGMEIAIAKAYADGYQNIWILDDDSWPSPQALQRLLAAKIEAYCVRSCRVIDPVTGNLSWPLQIKSGDEWRLVEGADILPDESVLEIRRSWLGALVPKGIYKSVGPVEGRLFLRGEDEGYPRRIENQGYQTYMIKDSILHHPPSGPHNRWSFGAFTLVMESGLRGDKLYYRLRNAWWIMSEQRGKLAAISLSLLHFCALMRWERPLKNWLPEWKQAFVDSMRDRLGKR